MIVALSGNGAVARRVSRLLHSSLVSLEQKKFPDGEIYLRFPHNLPHEEMVFVQSFHGAINDKLIETYFSAKSARETSKKLILVATYFPYLRQDKQFNPGEVVSNRLCADLVGSVFDEVFVFDPHLHRENTLSHIFSAKSTKLSANPLVADYIKRNIKNPFIIGPDWESYKWAESVARMVGCESAILEKKRISSRKVVVKLTKKIEISDKNVVIIDDIISTGHTLLEAIKDLRKIGAKKITCIGIHGIFVEGALEKLRKAKVNVVTTNTIPNPTSKIDVSQVIANYLSR
ncbi:ribose-phosphate diphosphokinase [Candidatus Woesearchaeota archaeon]|nr:ribose-phosphate diphosphokinase [Candidatus Woesearchaeota archaeon]